MLQPEPSLPLYSRRLQFLLHPIQRHFTVLRNKYCSWLNFNCRLDFWYLKPSPSEQTQSSLSPQATSSSLVSSSWHKCKYEYGTSPEQRADAKEEPRRLLQRPTLHCTTLTPRQFFNFNFFLSVTLVSLGQSIHGITPKALRLKQATVDSLHIVMCWGLQRIRPLTTTNKLSLYRNGPNAPS